MPRKARATDEENFRGDKIPPTNGSSRMPMIDPSELGMDEVHDTYVMPDLSEVKLKILQVSRQERDDGQIYYVCTHEIVGEDYAEEVADFIYMPHPTAQTSKQRNKTRLRLRDYATCFGLDIERPFNPGDDWPGNEGWVILGVREDNKYGKRNQIKEFRRPR
jgi:hypothetical protein